jgi:hypothetical protein
MTSLEHLTVNKMGKARGVWDELALFFKSNSLKTLDLSGCGEDVMVAECSCPQLQYFVGNLYYVDRKIDRAHLDPIDLQFFQFSTEKASRMVKAGDWSFYGADIPDSCVLKFNLFNSP